MEIPKMLSSCAMNHLPELLAPAGNSDAAYAAFQNGADAVYLGLRSLSARADAVNFSPAELAGLVAYAHSLSPRRAVYVTVNTLLRDADLHDALDSISDVAASGADAMIVQDPAVIRIARHFFPSLPIHASTQMAIHNAAGAIAARELGFSRVVLARELPIETIAEIVRESGVEIEVFVHGALCYSYSGMCLFSSHSTGRSGNRGRCAYCCRESFVRDGDPTPHPCFSMRDLAMLPNIPRLIDAGVASLKIEGRMKTPLYVAAVTDLYRRKLDGRLSPAEERDRISDLQTIFSRPTTALHADGLASPRAVIDSSAVGHRGAPIGVAEAIWREQGVGWMRFRSSRALERHDGIQIDIPGAPRPYGFPLLNLRLAEDPNRERIETRANSYVEISLPPDAPRIPEGCKIFCGSSLAVQRRFKCDATPTFDFPPQPIAVVAQLAHDGATFTAAAPQAQKNGAPLFATAQIPGPLDIARQPEATEGAIKKAFARLGGTRWTLGALSVSDPDHVFIPVSKLNDVRRELAERLDAAREDAESKLSAQRHAELDAWISIAKEKANLRADGTSDNLPDEIRRAGAARPTIDQDEYGLEEVGRFAPNRRGTLGQRTLLHNELWSVKLDVSEAPGAFDGADETILELGAAPWKTARRFLSAWRDARDGQTIRLALPPLTRQGDWTELGNAVAELARDGWRHWECADLAGLRLLRGLGDGLVESVTADSPLIAMNRLAKEQLREMGVSRVATSAEDDLQNILSHCACEPSTDALVFQHTPLFIAATPPDIPAVCRQDQQDQPYSLDASAWPEEGIRLRDKRGRTLRTLVRGGFSVTADERPFSAINAIAALRTGGVKCFRCDFRWLPLSRERQLEIWDSIRAGEHDFDFHPGNIERGLM